MAVCAILAAAGRGERMGRPKQLLDLGGTPVAGWSLEKLARNAAVRGISIACEADRVDAFRDLADRYGAGKVRAVVEGGARRQDSVRAALRHATAGCDVVVVHDGARPLFEERVLQEVIDAAQKAGAAIAAVRVKDTIKETNGSGVVLRTIPRERLWAAQTPQAFGYRVLVNAHDLAEADGFVGTDDAELVERYAGIMPLIVESSYENVKITTPDDLLIAQKIAGTRS